MDIAIFENLKLILRLKYKDIVQKKKGRKKKSAKINVNMIGDNEVLW